MKLKNCLERCLVVELRAMARQLDLKLQSMIKGDVVSQLEGRILEKAASGSLTTPLPDTCQLALKAVLDAGDSIPLERIQARFGELRRPITNGIESHQPWADGAMSPLDRLHVQGILFRAPAEGGNGEMALVPSDIRERLCPAEIPRPPVFRTAPSPAVSGRFCGLIRQDLMLLVSALQQSPANRIATGGISRRDLLRLNSHLLAPDDIGEARNERAARRFSFLRMVAETMGLLELKDGRVCASSMVTSWLALPPAEQHQLVVDAYLSCATCNEFDDIGAVQFVAPPGAAAISQARRFLLELLREAEPGEWYSLSSLIQAARTRNSLLLRRPEDGTVVKCAESGRTLTARDWASVEGGWIEAAVSGPLHWIGLVSPGCSRRGEVVSFRTSPLLTSSSHPFRSFRSETESLPGSPGPESEDCVFEDQARIDLSEISVGEDMIFRVGADVCLARWFRLERIGDLLQRGPVSRYRISREKVRQLLQAGVAVEAILNDLGNNHLGNDLPEAVAITIRGWANRFGQVKLFRSTVLYADDPALMNELQAAPEIQQCLDQRLGRRASTVIDGKQDVVIEELRRRGELPHVEPAPGDLDAVAWAEIHQALTLWKQASRRDGAAGPSERTLQLVAAHARIAGVSLECPEPDTRSKSCDLSLLERAIQQRRAITFEYADPSGKNSGNLVVVLRGMGQQHGVTYVSGYRKGGSSLVRFCVDHIRNVSLMEH